MDKVLKLIGIKKRKWFRDGRVMLLIMSMVLFLSGLFALLLSVTGKFLPHDERFLGMTAQELCRVQGCRIVHFMFHDRVSFGGALIAISLLYFWLTLVPLRAGKAWTWWLFLLSGMVGFASFFAYLGYGYLDTWHGLATLIILPCFIIGLIWSGLNLPQWESIGSLFKPSVSFSWPSPFGFGRVCLLATSIGLMVGGLTIMIVGMTCVFVHQDLEYLGLSVEAMQALNPHLLPLVAHDRAGFGGVVCCCGLTLFFCVWAGEPSPTLWIILSLVGIIGFGTAIGVHFPIGYIDVTHLAPAVIGAFTYFSGLALTYRRMVLNRFDSSVGIPSEVRHG